MASKPIIENSEYSVDATIDKPHDTIAKALLKSDIKKVVSIGEISFFAELCGITILYKSDVHSLIQMFHTNGYLYIFVVYDYYRNINKSYELKVFNFLTPNVNLDEIVSNISDEDYQKTFIDNFNFELCQLNCNRELLDKLYSHIIESVRNFKKLEIENGLNNILEKEKREKIFIETLMSNSLSLLENKDEY
jgi:hypothetical protein